MYADGVQLLFRKLSVLLLQTISASRACNRGGLLSTRPMFSTRVHVQIFMSPTFAISYLTQSPPNKKIDANVPSSLLFPFNSMVGTGVL